MAASENLTALGLAAYCKSKLGTPYVYGTKMEVLTRSKVATLRNQYPGTFTDDYVEKALKFAGQITTDCSGLISGYTRKIKGSSQYYSTATERIPMLEVNVVEFNSTQKYVGYAIYKPGHIGVVVDAGKIVEAKGINYGTITSSLGSTNWTHLLKLNDIKYTEVLPEGWHNTPDGSFKYMENGVFCENEWRYIDGYWYFFDSFGCCICDTWKQIDGYWYFFNPNGSMFTGWLNYRDNWYYLATKNDNISLAVPLGAMIANRICELDWLGGTNKYAFNELGIMLRDCKIIYNVNSKGVLEPIIQR